MILDGGTQACRLATVFWVGVSIRSHSSKDTRLVPRFGLQIFTNIYESQGVLSEVIPRRYLPAGWERVCAYFPRCYISLVDVNLDTQTALTSGQHLVVDGPCKTHRNM